MRKTTSHVLCLSLCLLVVLGLATAGWSDDVGPLLVTLRAAQAEGIGSEEAARAWVQLVQQNAQKLPEILAGLDGAGPLAANWIGSAADAIAQRAIAERTLPAAAIEQYVLDRRHSPRGRRMAFEWLATVDPSVRDRLLPGMLDEPSLELRRDAVARLVRQSDGLPDAEALPLLRQAIRAARDLDQISGIASQLKKRGETVDLPRLLGCVTRWKIIGPWDNTDGKGFDAVYPPEESAEPDFTKTYLGKPDKEGRPRQVKWIDHVVTSPLGETDFNKVLGEEKSVVGYAAAEIHRPRQEDVEVRCGSNSALKIWVNGRLVASYKVYHAGGQFDQYTCRATLRPGRNVLLVKVCQNAQPQPWANVWGVQLRVCDPSGGGVPSTGSGAAKEPSPPRNLPASDSRERGQG